MQLVRNFRTLAPRPISRYLLHWPLALLFFYSGSVKLLRLAEFEKSVGEFGIVLDGLVKPAAFMICIIELLLACVLWQQRSWAMLATSALLLCFVGTLVYGLAIGLDIECGCFGSGYQLKLGQQLGIDLMLLAWCLGGHRFLKNTEEENDA